MKLRWPFYLRCCQLVFTPLLLAIATLPGCAQAPETAAMVPTIVTPSSVMTEKTVAIMRAKGGEETNLFMMSSIDAEGFRKALDGALTQYGLFRIVFLDLNGDYELYPEILFQDALPGLIMRSVVKINYRLVEAWTDEVLWQQQITSTYDATPSEALYGVNRVRKAHEGAVRENLKKLLPLLSAFIAQAESG